MPVNSFDSAWGATVVPLYSMAAALGPAGQLRSPRARRARVSSQSTINATEATNGAHSAVQDPHIMSAAPLGRAASLHKHISLCLSARRLLNASRECEPPRSEVRTGRRRTRMEQRRGYGGRHGTPGKGTLSLCLSICGGPVAASARCWR